MANPEIHSIAMCAGEASGDLNGARLAAELMELAPGAKIWGAGGDAMRRAGVDVRMTILAGAIGIAQSLRVVPQLLRKHKILAGQIIADCPDVFVPIDFGAFNTRLARSVREAGVPVVYYFPPSSWRKRLKNPKYLAELVDAVITPFPWSAELLRGAGIDAHWVGHPLVDIVKPTKPREEFFAEHVLDPGKPVVGLLPGSRAFEISSHIGPMFGAATRLARELPGVQFVVAAGANSGLIERCLAAYQRKNAAAPTIRIVKSATYDCMAASDFLIATSGTATLEAAILGVPMAIIYRGTAIMRFEFLFRKKILEGHIGMPNIIAERRICPEMIGNDVIADSLADVVLKYMNDADARNEMTTDLAGVRATLGEPGAVKRAAGKLIEIAERLKKERAK